MTSIKTKGSIVRGVLQGKARGIRGMSSFGIFSWIKARDDFEQGHFSYPFLDRGVSVLVALLVAAVMLMLCTR